MIDRRAAVTLSTVGLISIIMTTATACIVTLPFDTLTGGVPRGGPSPTSHYTLDETSGATVHDKMGVNDGIVDADRDFPKWIAEGKKGGALDFGLDGWINFPKLAGRGKLPQVATFVMWTRPSFYFPATENGVLSLDEDDDDQDTLIDVFLTSNNVTLEATTATAQSLLTTPSVPENAWVLIAVGWDVVAKKGFLYVRPDGKDAYPLQLGDFPPSFTVQNAEVSIFSTNGSLDEIRFFDRLLTPEELAALD